MSTPPQWRRPTARTDAWGNRRTSAERSEWRRMGLRWRLADLLNRSKRTCWSDLVGWVQRDAYERREGSYTLRSTFSGKRCRTGPDFRRCGSCYCGKFQESP